MDCLPENLTEVMLRSETSQNSGVNLNNVDEEVANNPKQACKQSENMRFMLSGLTDDIRKDFFEFLKKHKIDFGDENMCDPKVGYFGVM